MERVVHPLERSRTVGRNCATCDDTGTKPTPRPPNRACIRSRKSAVRMSPSMKESPRNATRTGRPNVLMPFSAAKNRRSPMCPTEKSSTPALSVSPRNWAMMALYIESRYAKRSRSAALNPVESPRNSSESALERLLSSSSSSLPTLRSESISIFFMLRPNNSSGNM